MVGHLLEQILLSGVCHDLSYSISHHGRRLPCFWDGTEPKRTSVRLLLNKEMSDVMSRMLVRQTKTSLQTHGRVSRVRQHLDMVSLGGRKMEGCEVGTGEDVHQSRAEKRRDLSRG